MDATSLLVGLGIGALVGALAALLAASRGSARLREDLARARAELAAQGALQSQAKDTFVALSAEVLQGSQSSFLERAELLMGPVQSKLKEVDETLRALETAREGAYRALRQQLETMGASSDRLGKETANLANALRGPISRGRWGEIHLHRVAELSGMTAHCDFVEQTTLVGESGAQRPDMIVRLPGGKSLVVDAKVPLRAFLEAQEAPDDRTRDEKLGEHARLVRDHVTTLSRKAYADQLDDTPEFVVMFVPGEAFFSAAAQRDPELLEFAFARGVIPASPTNLVALLKTVHYGWQQENVAENAERIRDLGIELYDRIGTLSSHFAAMGAGLSKAVESYNGAMKSLQSRVLVSARNLKKMGAGSSKDLPDPVLIEEERTEVDSGP